MDKKIFFSILNRVYSDEINKFSMKPSKFKISISVENYDEKSVEKDRNCYVAEERIVSKLSKISIPNFDSTN